MINWLYNYFCDDIHYVSANITHYLKLTKQFAKKNMILYTNLFLDKIVG